MIQNFTIPPILENDFVSLKLIQESDFEALFSVASDPDIWEQHPERFRYELPVFTNFFEKRLQSKSAYLIYDKSIGEVIGSTSYYTKEDDKRLAIGYTFFATKYWGTKYNSSVKKLMLDYAFEQGDEVVFHVGDINIRSQKAVMKLGAILESHINNSMTFVLSKKNFHN
jgi:RimJ/RimL family protein N-acetyltransferase